MSDVEEEAVVSWVDGLVGRLQEEGLSFNTSMCIFLMSTRLVGRAEELVAAVHAWVVADDTGLEMARSWL